MQRQGHPQRNTREKTVEIDLVSFVSVSFLVLMGVLLFFLLLHFVKQFIPVKSFETSPESAYSSVELSAVAGINEGDKLYRIDMKKAESVIMKRCPYVKSINIKRTLFGKIKYQPAFI